MSNPKVLAATPDTFGQVSSIPPDQEVTIEFLLAQITDEILADTGMTLAIAKERLLRYPKETIRIKRPKYGYISKGGDPNLFVLDPVCILYFEATLDQLDNGISSYRQARDFLTSRALKYNFRTLSVMGLKNIRYITRPETSPGNLKTYVKPKRRTVQERSVLIRKQKIANAKRQLTNRVKRISKLTSEINKIKKSDEEITAELKIIKKSPVLQYSEVDYEDMDAVDHSVAVFKPNKGPQTSFLNAPELQVLYGGSAGGELISEFLPPPFVVIHQNKTRELLECLNRRISSQAKYQKIL